MSKKIALSALLFICTTHFGLSAIEARTYKKEHVYYVEGKVDAPDWYDRGFLAITDYANYRQWITKGIDGKDPISAEFWEHFTDFVYEAPNSITVSYDLNLPWPLGSKGNKARFKIDESNLSQGILKLRIMEKPAGLEDVVLTLYAESSNAESTAKIFRFEMALHFSWLLEALIDPEKLSTHMNIVIGNAVSNLQTYCSTKPN